MNKTLYWIGGVIIIVVIIIAVMSTGKSSSGPTTASSTEALTSSSVPVPSGVVSAKVARQSWHDIVSSGVSETCSFQVAASASSTSLSGTIFTALGNMKGDFIATAPGGKVTNAHIIVASSTGYIWTDSSPRGLKMPYAVMASSTALSNKQGGIDVNQPTDYSCTPWSADQSLFVVPKNIQFYAFTK